MTRALLVVAALGYASRLTAADKPNIVLVLADDLGYGDIGCYNPGSKVPTPAVDRLAAEGVRFTDAHSGSSVCSPTRYGILTGRYAWRTTLRRGVLGPYDPPLIAAGRLTLPQFLKGHGYRTACVGKWHLGWDWPRAGGDVAFDRPIPGGPTARGFDHYFGTDVPNYPPYCFLRGDRVVTRPTGRKAEQNLDGRPGPMAPGWRFDAILPSLVEEAAGFVAARGADREPFFLYVPLTSPHEPVAPSARFKGKSGINDLADFMMETDWAVGEVVAAVDRAGLGKNTLVAFTCDNGHAKYTGLPALTAAGHKVSGPLRGYKSDVAEGGHRVPFVARWPGVVAPGTVRGETICHTTFLATAADLLGAKLPAAAGEDSFSILPLLRGETPAAPPYPAVVHQAADGTLAVRRGKWKQSFLGPPEKPAPELYDLDADLGETRPLQADHPDVAARLRGVMDTLIADGRSTPGPAVPNDVPVPLYLSAQKKR